MLLFQRGFRYLGAKAGLRNLNAAYALHALLAFLLLFQQFALARDVAAVIREVIEKDPDAQVKRRAVSALHALPDGEGIPPLIEVAKTTQDAEVRRQAMSSLAQSRDPRVLAFLQDLLKR